MEKTGSERHRLHLQTLEELGPKFKIVDSLLMDTVIKRGQLARQVGDYKDLQHQPKIRRKIEEKRLKEAGAYAEENGLDPYVAQALLVIAIGESCKLQTEQSETRAVETDVDWQNGDLQKWLGHLRENLLELTSQIAAGYEAMYHGFNSSPATQMYLEYEWAQIRHEIENLRTHGKVLCALDLGCATGVLTRKLATQFPKVIGCDVSPAMLKAAAEVTAQEGLAGKIEYREVDFEKGLLGIESESVNLAVMNLGTASDVWDIKRLLVAVKRVLAPHGRFLLTFYNQQALLYRGFIPWPLSLKARANIDKKTLEVTLGSKMYSIFAHFYTMDKVKHLLKNEGLHVSRLLTYPTVGAILPNAVLGQQLEASGPSFLDAIKHIDSKMADDKLGAYILAAGSKRT